jgi:ketosteroid isomerase-like protein
MGTQSLSESDVASIQRTIESFTRCLEAQDFPNWVSHWATDGVLMPPDHPRVVGHDALVDFMRENFGDVESVNLADWKTIGEGGLAVVTTNVEWSAKTAKQPAEKLKQVIVLNKNADGKWLLKVIIFNAGV